MLARVISVSYHINCVCGCVSLTILSHLISQSLMTMLFAQFLLPERSRPTLMLLTTPDHIPNFSASRHADTDDKHHIRGELTNEMMLDNATTVRCPHRVSDDSKHIAAALQWRIQGSFSEFERTFTVEDTRTETTLLSADLDLAQMDVLCHIRKPTLSNNKCCLCLFLYVTSLEVFLGFAYLV